MNAAADTADARLVVFLLEDQRFGLSLDRIDRVLPMVAIRPFPKAPPIVTGVFVLHGDLVPVVNPRRRLRLPDRRVRTSDQLLVVRTRRRRLALVVDAVENVLEVPAAAITASDALVPGLEFVRGIVRLPREGIVFVQDLDEFLSLEEEAQLAAALSEPVT